MLSPRLFINSTEPPAPPLNNTGYGIIFGSIALAVVLFVALAIFFYFYRKKQREKAAETALLQMTPASLTRTTLNLPMAPTTKPPITQDLLDKKFTLTNPTDQECTICLNSLTFPCRTLQCNHQFHKDCIDEWFTTPQQPTLIPIARKDLEWTVRAQWKLECPVCRMDHSWILPTHIVTIECVLPEPELVTLPPTNGLSSPPAIQSNPTSRSSPRPPPQNQLEMPGRPLQGVYSTTFPRFGVIPAGPHYSAFSRSPAR